MRIRFQYTDWSEWEGDPEQAHESPDLRPPDGGVVRMFGITDDGREQVFVYDDFYYLYLHPERKLWVLGSGTPKREFIIHSDRSECLELPVKLLKGSVVRYGCTVSQEEAVKFGLIKSVDVKVLHEKVKHCIECEN